MKKRILCLFVLFGAALARAEASWWELDIEAGVARAERNDVRIPGEGGTRISLSDELVSKSSPFARFRLTHRIGERRQWSFLAAPLRISSTGAVDRPVRFRNTVFPSGERLTAHYRFDSYRLTHRWDYRPTPAWRLGIGATGKVRDAAVRIDGAGRRVEETNVGFVPLVNFYAAWSPTELWSFVLDGDALAAPQGRAEDVFIGILARTGKRLSWRAGYRILEGGADNDRVYSFALIRYYSLAMVVKI